MAHWHCAHHELMWLHNDMLSTMCRSVVSQSTYGMINSGTERHISLHVRCTGPYKCKRDLVLACPWQLHAARPPRCNITAAAAAPRRIATSRGTMADAKGLSAKRPRTRRHAPAPARPYRQRLHRGAYACQYMQPRRDTEHHEKIPGSSNAARVNCYWPAGRFALLLVGLRVALEVDVDE